LPVELERVDVWLDDERFFAPFVALRPAFRASAGETGPVGILNVSRSAGVLRPADLGMTT
jgi:hypothetical protein